MAWPGGGSLTLSDRIDLMTLSSGMEAVAPSLPLSRRGRRRLSLSMLAARDELTTPPPACPGKWDVANVLKSLRGCLPVSRAAAATLIVMVEKTRPEDWEPLGTPFIYAHNATLMGWTGLSRSALQRHIRELAEARFLVPQDGRNGQRGRRWQGQDGEMRVGFNLAALRYRWPELLALADQERQNRERIQFLRTAIADLNEIVRARAECLGQDDAATEAARIMLARLRVRRIGTLEGLYEAMVTLHETLDRAGKEGTQPHPVENPDKSERYAPKVGPMGPENGAHYTDTKNIQSSYEVVPVAATGRKRIEPMRRAEPEFPDRPSAETGRSALRGFKGTALFYLEICAGLREFCTSARPSSEDLIVGAEYLSGRIGVSHHAWGQACVVLGRLQAAICVIMMAARLERGAIIHRRDAYFRALVERGATSRLYLDRSLYALRDSRSRETGMLVEAGIMRSRSQTYQNRGKPA